MGAKGRERKNEIENEKRERERIFWWRMSLV